MAYGDLDYSGETYEQILQRMLARVPGDIDKREGSIIYDALAPAAVEIYHLYQQLMMIVDESFADTASREYLLKRCAERGLYAKPATAAVVKGSFTPPEIDVLLQKFNLDGVNYVAVEQTAPGTYRLECETLGEIGNRSGGTLLPIGYIEGLETAQIVELLVPGEEEEDTEALRKRYFASLESQAFGGNIADYKEKVNALDGVGGVKVYPVWNGGGTVKLVIINSEFTQPSSTLVEQVQTTIDPTQNHGEGVGLAPIGHVVTVQGVTATAVNIQTTITYETGWDFAALQPYIEATIDDYFAELNATWADSEQVVVRISQIESRLLNLSGVLDIANTTLNGAATNLALLADAIPVRGTFNA